MCPQTEEKPIQSQAGITVWYKDINKFIQNEIKMKKNEEDPCIYHTHFNEGCDFIRLYIDDVLIIAEQLERAELIITALHNQLWMKLDTHVTTSGNHKDAC